MNNIIKKICKSIIITEDIEIINNILKELYIEKNMSTKTIASQFFIPIPITSAIKKELIKANLVEQQNGICLSSKGVLYVEDILGFKIIEMNKYRKLIEKDITTIEQLKLLKCYCHDNVFIKSVEEKE